MLFAFLLILLLFLTIIVIIQGIYLWRFANILLVLEYDFADAVETFQGTFDRLSSILEMPLFFDSPEVKREVQEALQSVKVSRVEVAKMIMKFTARSKHKYTEIETIEEPLNNDE